MPINDQALFRELGEHTEQLKGLARSDEEIKESIKARSVESQEQHVELVQKFDALATDMRQIEWLRADHTTLKSKVLDLEEMVRANRDRLTALETFRAEFAALKLDERLHGIEGYTAGRREAEGRRKWLRRVIATAVAIVGAVLGAVATAIAVVQGWIQLFPARPPGPH